MKRILIHLGLVAAVSLVLVLIVLYGLKSYTNHDDPLVEVVALADMTGTEALNALGEAGLEGVIYDTVFKDGAAKWAVINQNPEPGQMVKPGRKVYLVINTGEVPMVTVPDLAQKTSLNQAQNILVRNHLRVGRIIKEMHPFVHSRTDEPVLAQYEHNTRKELKPGSLIERNSMVDLVVGISMDYYDNDSTAMDSAMRTE